MVREARRRAGLTQAELAGRVGTTQSAIARIESGATEPGMWRVAELVSACGLHLTVRITEPSPELSAARRNLALSPDQRVRNMLKAQRFAAAGRTAKAAKTEQRRRQRARG